MTFALSSPGSGFWVKLFGLNSYSSVKNGSLTHCMWPNVAKIQKQWIFDMPGCKDVRLGG